jgi:hypothetical protein
MRLPGPKATRSTSSGCGIQPSKQPNPSCVPASSSISKAAESSQRLLGKTGLFKTDIVNRAITIYEFLDDAVLDQRTAARGTYDLHRSQTGGIPLC